jgi:tetratricopeptide (TPR) repeat protein
MNLNDDISADAKDEEQIASALTASEADAAPPDREFLAQLRGQSTEAFAAAAAQAAGQTSPGRNAWPTGIFRRRRWLGAAAAAIVIGVALYYSLAPGASGVALGQVLDNVEKADTLYVRMSDGDKKMEYWHTSKPKRSRWDDLNGNYSIADGKTHWVVNEKTNEARRVQPAPNASSVDELLNLLGLRDDRATILAALPVERVRDGDSDVLVYRTELLLRKEQKVQLEARVAAQTQQLLSMRTWAKELGKVKPLAELTVIAYDEPIGAEKFVVAETLTEDGRIGKVTDVQGIVAIRPVLHERWTPVPKHLVLKPGDWVRTDARGANATALCLVKQTGVILGPKTLVELLGPKQVRLIEGEIEINPSPGTTVEVLGPAKQKANVTAKQIFQVAPSKQGLDSAPQLTRVDKEPSWLLGFKGATTNETLGSLVALVDGRNVPLTVGYHKVSVDIRDQIARTVIEESFVNHTNAELEGVFYFPLPPDASISGFGMWIGDNLVEADVVEKQRAREIYETILRERRDPGLLEWSGGNIFKARVFPIPANSQKRIKITYTQVLPLQGSCYRYSYALQSELLKQHPLRELSIDVKVHSVMPLASVSSPTHPTRDERTAHSAHVEFTAQEYTPTRDFEVVVELEGRQAEVVMIPHRRGDDGYFMLQLAPPGGNGDPDRPLLPNGEPLNLLVLADTSASIDAGQRATQAAFIGSLLAALTSKDTFNLAACDVTCDWVFTQSSAADAKNVTAARDFLAKRSSLGWTDLDTAFASALKQCVPKTHVIYVGDGIVTAGDADPIAFTKRLRRLYQGHGGTFHAVTLGSSHEAAVMKAIASLGGGSMRKITTEQGPALVAREVLGEISRPALRDIKVEFKGFKAARVYPETLANIPAGTQQILLGRYLPGGKDQTGEVIVTGTLGGKSVRFTTRTSLKDAEHGNSFIPRLWARMHLDSLLEQGASETIKDQIIALSEEYQIITPYTSFLVLETDADRERFKVKRRFQMRDGERFFGDGRDNAMFDLAQKQKKKAGGWRTALRRSVLNELARLGREPRMFHPRSPFAGAGGGLRLGEDVMDIGGPMTGAGDETPLGMVPEIMRDELGDLEERAIGNDETGHFDVAEKSLDPEAHFRQDMQSEPQELAPRHELSNEDFLFRDYEFGRPLSVMNPTIYDPSIWDGSNGTIGFREDRDKYLGGRYRRWGPGYGDWLGTLFPPLPGTRGKMEAPKSTWPAAARELAKSLLRTERLAKMAGGIEIVRQTDIFDPRWGDLASRSRRLELASAESWLTRTESDGGQTVVGWCDAKEIGFFSKSFQLGRVRASPPRGVQPPPLALKDHSMSSLETAFAGYTPSVEPQGKDRTLLVLKYDADARYETRILIDTAWHVILSIEDRRKGKVTSTTRFDDFTQAAGAWWAQRIETTNADGKRLSLVAQTVKTLTSDVLNQQTKTELAGRAQVQFLHLPMPSIAQAKTARTEGKAGFNDQFVLLLHFHQSQQWTRVLDHLQQAEKLAAGKPGIRWLRSELLNDSRRHEELRQRYQEDARRIANGEPADAYFLAQHILRQSAQVLQANEMLALLDTLKPLYEKQPPHLQAGKRWLNQRVSYLNQAGRTDEALKLQKQLATDYPRDHYVQQQYAQALASAGDYPAAYAWLTRVLVKEAKWDAGEEESLRGTYAGFLQQQGRFAELVKYLADWVERNPPGRTAYDQYLTALIKADQIEKADALVVGWLKDAQVVGELAPAAEARMFAAIQLMLGNGYQLWTNRIEERWLTPLAKAALFFARHEGHADAAEQILSNHVFRRTDEAPRVRKELAGFLSGEVDKLPAEQVRRLAGWVQREDAEPAAWDKIRAALRKRWTNEAKDEVKHVLGQALVTILAHDAEPKELLAFLRLQHQNGPQKYRAEYANQIFNNLLSLPWSAEFETEALTLLDKLSDAQKPGARLFASVAALHRLTDRMLENRAAAKERLLEHPEKLTRTELLKKQDENRKLAREGLADSLRKEAAKHQKALGQWLLAESLYLNMLLERNLKQVAAEAWKYIETPAPKITDDAIIERNLDDVLRQRYLVTLTNLAARKNAEPALIAHLVKYFDKEISAHADAEANLWKLAKYRLLIALDRPKDLEETLRQWTRQDDPDSRWGVALGYLLAEQGKLADAIRQFEAVESADELSPSAYRSLADWYLVQSQRESSERASAAVYKTTPEHRISQMIAAKLSPWQRKDGHLPTQLDKEVLRQFAVLFDKSVRPEIYLYQLQQFYQASHDFRLLAVLPEAVIGHSADRIYPFVQGMQSVLEKVRDEATADEIVKRIAEVRPRAKTAVDKRALDMLEVLVERRSAELINQPGPHTKKALAALERAAKDPWGPGESRLMADFLAGLGKITQPALAAEQLKQLKSLHTDSKAGSIDRLHIAHRYGLTLNGQGRRLEAIDLLQSALDEFQAAHDGVLPVSANTALLDLIGWLEDAGQFARGEKALLVQLTHPVHQEQRRWLIERVGRLYHHALQNNGDVSLGKGLALYQALNAKIQKDLSDIDQSQRYRLINLLCDVYRTGHEKKLAGAVADLKAFAFEIGPPLVKQQINNHDSIVTTIAQTLRDLAGPRDGIVFLLNEIETEPRWLRYNNQDGWNRHASTLALWRTQSKDLGKAEDRLLKLVLAELHRDLSGRDQRNRAIYQHQSTYYWKEKAADFAKTAESVLAERSKSSASVQYIATYFYHGLGQPKRAIEILLAAHKQKILEEDAQAKLVEFLHLQKRYAESIPLLAAPAGLIERRPANIGYRVQLMHAYFKTAKNAELLGLLNQTDAFFHEKNRWGEHPLSHLAASTLQNELFDQSVAYYKELIGLHERTHPGRGIGNGTLSGYYSGLAKAYAGLKKTPEAVDAAGAAIVAWGPRRDNRGSALETLKFVLRRSSDLDGFVAHLDKQKQDSAIVRKAIGEVYREKKEHLKAIAQLELAAALQPNDAEVYQLLVASYDDAGDKEGGTRHLLQAVQHSRRDLELYQDLGNRYAAAGAAHEAERAYTSIVEMLPTESESHALLAEIREKQDRWTDAIHHWQQVAHLRALEPTGLLKLAAAQIHQKQWDQARETLRQLDSRTWPPHFGDVPAQVRELRERMAKEKKE